MDSSGRYSQGRREEGVTRDNLRWPVSLPSVTGFEPIPGRQTGSPSLGDQTRRTGSKVPVVLRAVYHDSSTRTRNPEQYSSARTRNPEVSR